MRNLNLHFFILFILLYTFSNECLFSQNVGIGTSTPLEKLHVNGNVRVDGLASSDTSIVLSDFDGKLINIEAGTTGQVLTSQGPGRAPKWSTSSFPGIYVQSLSGSPFVQTSPSSAGSLTLLTHNFTPQNDTVLFTFTSQGRLTSTITLPSQPPTFIFRIIVNGSIYRQFYQNVAHNSNSTTTTGFVPISFSIPVPVNPNVNNTISIQILTFFTSSGTYTLTYDTSAFTQFANSIIYDFPTN